MSSPFLRLSRNIRRDRGVVKMGLKDALHFTEKKNGSGWPVSGTRTGGT
jgi:hypothetical protein